MPGLVVESAMPQLAVQSSRWKLSRLDMQDESRGVYGSEERRCHQKRGREVEASLSGLLLNCVVRCRVRMSFLDSVEAGLIASHESSASDWRTF